MLFCQHPNCSFVENRRKLTPAWDESRRTLVRTSPSRIACLRARLCCQCVSGEWNIKTCRRVRIVTAQWQKNGDHEMAKKSDQ
jgi:hypothetical protein